MLRAATQMRNGGMRKASPAALRNNLAHPRAVAQPRPLDSIRNASDNNAEASLLHHPPTELTVI
jgi:hypothetical protein